MKRILIAIVLFTLLLSPTVSALAGENISTQVSMEISPEANEVRAVWVTRWQYNTEADIIKVIDTIAENHFNTVFFQVRGEADAFYKSSYEPWSKELTGTLGKDPGFDPLAVAIKEAHAKGLKLHAWVNNCTVWKGAKAPDEVATPKHLYYTHPEWFQVNDKKEQMKLGDGYIFLNPVLPEAQDHLMKVFKEIVTNYDVDGLHLDYIRFPGANYGYDDTTQALFKKQKKFKDFGNWRRDELTKFVTKVADMVHETSAHKKQLSTAVIGYYHDKWGWGYEKSGSFDKYMQDSKRWIKESRVDFIAPMIYWVIGGKPDFTTLVKDFASVNPKKVVVGMSTTDFSATETWNQIMVTRKNKMKGFSLFSYESNFKLWDTFKAQIAQWSIQ